MNQLCEPGLLPGVMADHTGRCFQYFRDVDGTLTQRTVNSAPLSAKTQAALQSVLIESIGRPGVTYRSMACFQQRGE